MLKSAVKLVWLTSGKQSRAGATAWLCVLGLFGFYSIVERVSTELPQLLSLSSISSQLENPRLVSLFTRTSAYFDSFQDSSKPKAASQRAEWQPIKKLIASTPARRLQAAQKLGIAKGEYYLAFVSVNCSTCDEEALKLNQKKNRDRVIAFTVAPSTAVDEWQKRLNLKFPVRSLSQEEFDDLGGVVLLPTLIHLQNGVAVGASETADSVE
jgi:hypothetical protein